MSLSIVMPTIQGREDELERTIAAYERLTPREIEWIVERDHPTVASAWNAGAAKATGAVLHLGNDDLEPESDEWFPAALAALAMGSVPVGWVREHGLVFGRDFPRVPVCMRSWWEPLDPRLHYWADNQFGDVQAKQGHFTIVMDDFDFLHRKSMIGRDESAERLARDHAVYEAQRG